MSRQARRPLRIYVTDCEGPLSRNDNAQELAERFIHGGADLFARLSRYDDFLADVAHRPGYNAGDTLRLLAPFLLAAGATDQTVVEASSENVLLVPGARAALAELQRLMPTFIISTSYTPYIRALCNVTGFPIENCRCTQLNLDEWRLNEDEGALLRDWAARIIARPVIDIPAGAASINALSQQDRQTVAELDRLFWTQLQATVSGELMAAIRPVGGRMKLAALEQIVARVGCARRDVMYVGDSITDAPPLEAVRRWGGASLSFNGNNYALAAAEFAAASADVSPSLTLAHAFAVGGTRAVREAARKWPSTAGGLVGVVAEKRGVLTAASLTARKSVRGERVASLG